MNKQYYQLVAFIADRLSKKDYRIMSVELGAADGSWKDYLFNSEWSDRTIKKVSFRMDKVLTGTKLRYFKFSVHGLK